MELNYIVKENDSYKTINQILLSEFNLSTRLTTKLIKDKRIYRNENIADSRDSVHDQDIILVDLNYEEDNSNIIPIRMNLKIIYEDEWLLVVDKPFGIAIHPSRSHYDDSLSNGVRSYFDSIGLKKKIRPVNRLDYDTSGLVIFAKCEYIQEQLIKQMLQGTFYKEYICIVEGIINSKQGLINLPIARKQGSIIERCVHTTGQNSITHYKIIQEFEDYSLVQCKLETGRTHQIRVHMKEMGHPIIGDTLYNKSSNLISRQALHSSMIECIHPITKETLTFTSPIPKDMKALLQ